MQAELAMPPEHRAGATPAVAGPQRTVLLVDDHDLIRLGTRMVLDTLPGLSCRTIEASSLDEALGLCAVEPQIDLVLLDLNLCDAKGLQGLQRLLDRRPDLQIAVMTGTGDEVVIRQAQRMGAVGWLLKSWSPDRISLALRSLLAPPHGAAALPSALLAERFPKLAASHSYDRVAELGSRHLQILELVLSGCNNQEVSDVTGLAVSTVKNYVSAILLALDVKSRGHLISLFH